MKRGTQGGEVQPKPGAAINTEPDRGETGKAGDTELPAQPCPACREGQKVTVTTIPYSSGDLADHLCMLRTHSVNMGFLLVLGPLPGLA